MNPAALIEVTRRDAPPPEMDDLQDDAGMMMEIETDFRRKLMGLRRRPWNERAAALRAAKEWRKSALKALREKRAGERHARHLLRRLRAPAPN